MILQAQSFQYLLYLRAAKKEIVYLIPNDLQFSFNLQAHDLWLLFVTITLQLFYGTVWP